MNNFRHSYTFSVACFLYLLSTVITSAQEGSSYFFYQQSEYPRDCKEVQEQCTSDNLNSVYTIKPNGYPNPFEVYCENQISSGGWTIIHRRFDGSLTFKRNWEDYKFGFGFLSTEYWVGNDKLSYLTNQDVYELRIDIVLSNGSSFYFKYNSFRISDEWRQYALVNAEDFSGNSSCVVSTCPAEMTHKGCTCQRKCSDSFRATCQDDCVENCVPRECRNSESFITAGCTQNCTCIDNEISCNPDYECSPDATCIVKDGVQKCHCKDDYEGDGETCYKNTAFADCYDAYQAGFTTNGIYVILPTGWPGSPFSVFCNMTFAEGGWSVFQRRTDGVSDFYLDWENYRNGFGSLDEGNDFWLGNEHLHYLTNQKDYVLRIDVITNSDFPVFEEYTSFRIGNESTKYQLSHGGRSQGNGANNFQANNGGHFSTYDQDNDGCSFHDCAEEHRGGWWYNPNSYVGCRDCWLSYPSCFRFETNNCAYICTGSNLNGDYNLSSGIGRSVYYYNCYLKYAEMKIRPSST
ncbi:Ryncolin-4 [Holothuria leucospilota]|uniref:Ryncolin-4 n=1 Tax=Holothuria leucospilota TaxID=206669 RepID=A0A9Q1CA56_HOLLE|nr:Ryncolin-4 [Holothuria leucospilota]